MIGILNETKIKVGTNVRVIIVQGNKVIAAQTVAMKTTTRLVYLVSN